MPATAAASSLPEVPSDTHGAEQRPGRVLNQHAARERDQRSADGRGRRGEGVGLLLGPRHERPGPRAEGGAPWATPAAIPDLMVEAPSSRAAATT